MATAPSPAPSPRKGFGIGKKIALALVVLIAALTGFIATRPAEFRIERTAQVKAPPDAVFPLIDNLHNWESWSPFEKLDPEMKKTYSGPESGPGASYAWNGNSQAGEGRMTIEESKPNDGVDMKLEFTRPFASTCKVKFLLVPDSGGTKVTWRMEGSNSFIGKLMSLVMNMDQMVGKDFEEGLSKLGTVAQETVMQEKAPASN